jgi:hypothetical protein
MRTEEKKSILFQGQINRQMCLKLATVAAIFQRCIDVDSSFGRSFAIRSSRMRALLYHKDSKNCESSRRVLQVSLALYSSQHSFSSHQMLKQKHLALFKMVIYTPFGRPRFQREYFPPGLRRCQLAKRLVSSNFTAWLYKPTARPTTPTATATAPPNALASAVAAAAKLPFDVLEAPPAIALAVSVGAPVSVVRECVVEGVYAAIDGQY